MKKIFATVSITAMAAAVHAQYAPGLNPQEQAKIWTLSADVRGFYDDNYLTLPNHTIVIAPNGTAVSADARSSWGVEASPSFSLNHSAEDTLVSLSYVYDARYYADQNTTDQSHQLNMRLEHEFSERDKVALNESFVSAQEPTILDPTVVSSPLRIQGNNIRNTGQLDWTHALTSQLDLHMGYANTVYSYQEVGGDETPFPYSEVSPAAALDRIEQLATLDLRWKFKQNIVGVLGYQFGHVDFSSPEYIIWTNVNPTTGGLLYPSKTAPPGAPRYAGPGDYTANVRNDNSHFAFVGADATLAPNVNASLRVGAEYLDYYNANSSSLSPYADANITYEYQPHNTAQLGVKEVHNSTDVTGFAGTSDSPVLDEQSTAAYLNVNHQFSDRLTASFLGQAQFSTFNGGGAGFNGVGENFYVASINFAYHFNPFLLTELGYSYNRLYSHELLDRSYVRDFVYFGFRATY